jgi:voltage-gated potassium channel
MKKRILFLLFIALGSLAVNGGLFWIFENETNKTIHSFFDVVWWWVVTSATVGYGDIVPTTWPGRVVGIVTILLGVFSYTGIMALIIESAHDYIERRERGRASVSAKDHIVLCEYTAVADELIHVLPGCPPFAGRPIVIVSDLISTTPYPQHHFVNGVPLSPVALRQANVKDAAYVFIFANLRFADPDVKTLHTAVRAHEMNPRATIFVELMDIGNPLLKKMSWPAVPIESRKLMEAVLSKGRINPAEWLPAGHQPHGE